MNWLAEVRRVARQAGVELSTETADELAGHIEDLYLDALERQVDEPTARREALRALDTSAVRLRPLHHEPPRQSPFWSLSMIYALRMAFRQLWLAPGFALVTAAVLGLSTGAAAIVYTVVDTVVFRPLPYRAPDRLVKLWDTNVEQGLHRDPFSPVTFLDYKALPVFADAAAWWRPDVNLVDPGLEPARVTTIETSANLFAVLGVTPQLGPGFPAGGPLFSDDLVVVISDRLWRTRYAADPSIIDRMIRLNDRAFRVTGVMPPGFRFPDDVDVWQRLNWNPAQHDRQAHFMEGVARLADGVALTQAQAAAETLATQLGGRFPVSNKGWSFAVVPLLDDLLGYYRPALFVLVGAVGILFLIGCLNVGSLLLTRGLSRERELAVRTALGATPKQIVVQLFAESLALSAVGAFAGLVVALLAIPAIVAMAPPDIPRLADVVVGWRVLLLTVALMAGMTTIFGLVPAAMLMRRRVAAGLRAGDRGSSRSVRRLYQALVTAEVALACALLVCSALLVRTVDRMTHVPVGIEGDDTVLATVQIAAVSSAEAAWQKVGADHAAILERLRDQPGILSAGSTNILPLEHGWRGGMVRRDQASMRQDDDAPRVQHHSVSEGYFETMGATLIEGRGFTAHDAAGADPVVILNRSAAERFFPGESAVGREMVSWMFQVGPLGRNLMWKVLPDRRAVAPRLRVVGVVADVQNVALGLPPEPAAYYPMRQFPFAGVTIAIAARDSDTAVRALREAIRSVSPNTPIGAVDTWGGRFRSRTAQPRLLMTMLTAFGAVAAFLATIGVYGLFSWFVAMRQRELAIRLTLGARPVSVAAGLLRHSLILVAAGLAGGWLLVRAANTSMTTVVFGVSANDPVSIAAGGVLLLVAALVASLPPAWRAMRLDPVVGLRAE